MRRVLFACLLSLASIASAEQPVPTVSAEKPAALRPASDFATLPFIVGPKLSPDGTRYAARLSTRGTQVLSIIKLFEPESPPLLVALGENELLSWTWVNNDWLVIRVGALAMAEGSPFYVTRIAGLSADGKTMNPISFKEGGQSTNILWTASDGSPRVLISRQKSIYMGEDFWPAVNEVDISTGKMRQIVNPYSGVMRWYADPAGAVRMGIGYNDSLRSSRLMYRDNAKSGFRTIDRAEGRRDERLTMPILSGSGTAAMTIGAPDRVAALYELDLGSLSLGKKIWGIDNYDIDNVLTDDRTGALLGISYTSDHDRVHWVDPAMAELQEQLDKAVGKRHASIASMSADRNRALIHVGDGSQPGSYYYYDVARGGAMQRVAHVNDAVQGASLSPVSMIKYRARDGLSIEAILTLPKGKAATNLPLILMPHGGPEARDSETYDWWAQFLADRGYAVIQPNYRGSTGYGEALRKAGDNQWGLAMQDDLNDAVDHLAQKGVIDPKRVCIMGASYGGYAALRGAQRDGKRYRCAVSYAGVSDLNGMLSYDSQFLNGNTARAGWRESAPDLKAVSPINFPEAFSTPILVMHGKKDLRVPVSQSRRMVSRLKDAGKPVTYIEQPLGDHHFSRQADRLQFLEAIEAFLKTHNPA